MINQTSVEAVEGAVWGSAGLFRRPLYESYGFARLPATLEYLLTGDAEARARGLPADVLGRAGRRHEVVVLILVDGFGWRLFERHAAALPFLQRLALDGVASKLTSQFPSTTAAHMTTLHTGLTVGQSGVHEWFYYEPAAGAVIAPLLFSFAGDRDRETLRRQGLEAADLFPSGTFYQRLAEKGIACSAFQPTLYAESTFSRHSFAGARLCPYQTVAGGLEALAADLLAGSGRRYYFFYIDDVDHAGHGHGLDAPEFLRQVTSTFEDLENRFYQRVGGRLADALLLVTADHGLTRVSPATTVYLNQALPDLPGRLRRGAGGAVLPFGGSCRDLFLYVRDEEQAEVRGQLERLLEGKAEVHRTRPLVADGLFGPPPYDRLLPRLADLVVLPYAAESVFWSEPGRFEMRHRGSHGGLTPEEMETGLYLLQL
jgi:hypothetical protein